MTNAAAELARLLDQWNPVQPGESVMTLRGMMETDTDEFWIGQVKVAGLLAQILRDLDSLEAAGTNVDHYRRAIPSWAGAVFVPEMAWSDVRSVGESVLGISSLDMLKGFADLVEASDMRVRVPRERSDSILLTLAELTDLIKSDELDLGLAQKRYAFELLNSVRAVLDSASISTNSDFVRRVNELVGFLTLLADELDLSGEKSDLSKRVRLAARKIVPWIVWSSAGGATIIGMAADLKSITEL